MSNFDHNFLVFRFKMPLGNAGNARINKLKNISRKLFEDTLDDREKYKKRMCHGIQTKPVHLESTNNIPTTYQTSNNHCEFTRDEDDVNQNANEDNSSHNIKFDIGSSQEITPKDRLETEQVTYCLI